MTDWDKGRESNDDKDRCESPDDVVDRSIFAHSSGKRHKQVQDREAVVAKYGRQE